jgi:PrtD family type I secretion system ABC transporter
MTERRDSRSLRKASGGSRFAVGSSFAISGVVNILALAGSFYMLQVYDRVLSSHSVPTLVALSVLVVVLYLFQGVLDVIRAQVLVRLGTRLDQRLMPLAAGALTRLPRYGASSSQAVQPIRDIDTIRGFLSGQGLVAILDLPWMPLYLAFVFLLHPWLGFLATAGLAVLVGLTFLTEKLTSDLSVSIGKAGTGRMAMAETFARNTEVLRSMGLATRAHARFMRANTEYLARQAKASDIGGTLSGISRVLRMILQSGILGLGAYLTLRGELTSGAIIAGAIATSRAFAPIELAIAHWKSFVAARHSFARFRATLNSLPPEPEPLQLPAPSRSVVLEGVTVPIPGTSRIVVNEVSFELAAREAVGIIGPSGAGKSSLARAITSVWGLARGNVRLDGAALDRWSPDGLGRHIGYLPQDVELLAGSVADNISRMEDVPDSGAVIAAARAADVHEMILRLPEGYETTLGPDALSLSAGQRQRIALARALYKDPFLVVLDEPNSNLDEEGDAALAKAILGVRNRGGIAVVIAHRRNTLAVVDKVAVMTAGRLTAFGARDEVLRKVLRPTPAAGGGPTLSFPALSVVAESGT